MYGFHLLITGNSLLKFFWKPNVFHFIHKKYGTLCLYDKANSLNQLITWHFTRIFGQALLEIYHTFKTLPSKNYPSSPPPKKKERKLPWPCYDLIKPSKFSEGGYEVWWLILPLSLDSVQDPRILILMNTLQTPRSVKLSRTGYSISINPSRLVSWVSSKVTWVICGCLNST